MEHSPGAAETELRRQGRRYAVITRTVVLTCASAVAVYQAPLGHRPLLLAVAVLLAAWSAVLLLRGPRTWVVGTDVALIVLLCLTQPWTVPAEALVDSTNWVLAAVSITAIAHQWYTGTAAGLALTTTVVVAHLAGNALADPAAVWSTVPVALWTFAEAALSRGLFLLLRAGARNADRASAEAERVRRDAAVAAARRADERAYLAVLHDTAASTMLAAGTGTVDGSEPWLREQAARDLDALGSRPRQDGEVDLVRLLEPVVRHSPVAVDLSAPPVLRMPSAPAVAISGAAGEALANVARHAGVDRASLVVGRSGDAVTVEVTDDGRGFDPESVSPHRRGLSGSVVARMAGAGGRATVTTGRAEGTRVRLEWPA